MSASSWLGARCSQPSGEGGLSSSIRRLHITPAKMVSTSITQQMKKQHLRKSSIYRPHLASLNPDRILASRRLVLYVLKDECVALALCDLVAEREVCAVQQRAVLGHDDFEI